MVQKLGDRQSLVFDKTVTSNKEELIKLVAHILLKEGEQTIKSLSDKTGANRYAIQTLLETFNKLKIVIAPWAGKKSKKGEKAYYYLYKDIPARVSKKRRDMKKRYKHGQKLLKQYYDKWITSMADIDLQLALMLFLRLRGREYSISDLARSLKCNYKDAEATVWLFRNFLKKRFKRNKGFYSWNTDELVILADTIYHFIARGGISWPNKPEGPVNYDKLLAKYPSITRTILPNGGMRIEGKSEEEDSFSFEENVLAHLPKIYKDDFMALLKFEIDRNVGFKIALKGQCNNCDEGSYCLSKMCERYPELYPKLVFPFSGPNPRIKELRSKDKRSVNIIYFHECFKV